MRRKESDEFPSILHNGKKYWQVGCTKCQNGTWKIFAIDGSLYIAECERCGHTAEMGPPSLKMKPDGIGKTVTT